jgi:hypothetical protein
MRGRRRGWGGREALHSKAMVGEEEEGSVGVGLGWGWGWRRGLWWWSVAGKSIRCALDLLALLVQKYLLAGTNVQILTPEELALGCASRERAVVCVGGPGYGKTWGECR